MFQKLDSHKSGHLLMSEMRKFFSATLHPDVLCGRQTPEEVWFGMFGYLETRDHATIDYAVSTMLPAGVSGRRSGVSGRRPGVSGRRSGVLHVECKS